MSVQHVGRKQHHSPNQKSICFRLILLLQRPCSASPLSLSRTTRSFKPRRRPRHVPPPEHHPHLDQKHRLDGYLLFLHQQSARLPGTVKKDQRLSSVATTLPL